MIFELELVEGICFWKRKGLLAVGKNRSTIGERTDADPIGYSGSFLSAILLVDFSIVDFHIRVAAEFFQPFIAFIFEFFIAETCFDFFV